MSIKMERIYQVCRKITPVPFQPWKKRRVFIQQIYDYLQFNFEPLICVKINPLQYKGRGVLFDKVSVYDMKNQ